MNEIQNVYDKRPLNDGSPIYRASDSVYIIIKNHFNREKNDKKIKKATI